MTIFRSNYFHLAQHKQRVQYTMSMGINISQTGDSIYHDGKNSIDRGFNIPSVGDSISHREAVDIPWVEGQNSIGKVFIIIPWVGVRYTMGRGSIYHGKGFDISWVGGHYIISSGFYIPGVVGQIPQPGVRYAMDRVVKIPYRSQEVQYTMCRG